MCRNIKTLYNFDPPATDEEIHTSALQYVRKISGFRKPSVINEEVFNLAVLKCAEITSELLSSLVTNAPKRNRMTELERSRNRRPAR